MGIEFQKSVIDRLYSLQNEIRKLVGKGRFPSRENLHLTLQFLGEIPENRIPDIVRSLEPVAGAHDSFRLSFSDRLGYFGPQNPVRVVWLGFTGELSALLRLQKNIAVKMQGLGLDEDKRPYHPHITLIRDADFIHRAAVLKNGWIDFDVGPSPDICVRQFTLIASCLEQGKRVYRPLAAFSFDRDRRNRGDCADSVE